MRSIRIFCILLCLCLLTACAPAAPRSAAADRPPVHVTYTPDPTMAPAELIEAIVEPTAAPRRGSEVTALLYAGESMRLYRGYLQGEPGVFLVSRHWDRTLYRFQELPGTLEQTELTIVAVDVEPLKAPAEARVYIRYLDDDGAERILCADRSHEKYTLLYPLSPEPGMALTEDQRQKYGDLMLMGYIRERVYRDYRLYMDDMEAWESSWQWCILDALFYNYGDALPPYLDGETVEVFDGDEHAALVSKAELDLFFQSALGMPCVVQAREGDRQVYPELQPDQIILYPSEYYFTPDLVQAVREPDGTICLYGRMSGFEMSYCVVICRIRPVEGYLGGQLISAEMYPAVDVANDPALKFAP